MNKPEIRLEAFSGPLDLLLHLIEKNEINIYHIPIFEITRQYVDFINEYSKSGKGANAANDVMDFMSSFIVMAARLLEIKSRLLLPLPKKDEDSQEEGDPREALIAQLLEYKRFKALSQLLQDREGCSDMLMERPPHKSTIEIASKKKPPSVEAALKNVDLDRLKAIYEELLLRQELNTDKIRGGFKSVEKDRFTVGEKITHITHLIRKNRKVSLNEVFARCTGKQEMVVSFLAMLEMIKQRLVSVEQNTSFGEIILYALESAQQ